MEEEDSEGEAADNSATSGEAATCRALGESGAEGGPGAGTGGGTAAAGGEVL